MDIVFVSGLLAIALLALRLVIRRSGGDWAERRGRHDAVGGAAAGLFIAGGAMGGDSDASPHGAAGDGGGGFDGGGGGFDGGGGGGGDGGGGGGD